MNRIPLVVIALALSLTVVPSLRADVHQPDPAKPQRAAKTYGQLPLSFTANQGQFDPGVAFQTRGSGYSISLTHREAVFSLKRSTPRLPDRAFLAGRSARDKHVEDSANVAMQFLGASGNASISGVEELPGKANYLIGNDQSKWHTEVPTYARVKYAGLYPGIDLVYYGNQSQLEFDFIVQPGADATAVKLAFHGDHAGRQAKLEINQSGDLLIGEPGHQVVLPRPVVYQLTGDAGLAEEKRVVDASYVLLPGHQVRFQIGAYDKSRALVIDPTVAYSTLLGSSQGDFIANIAVNDAGEAFVTGSAGSDFPTTPGVFNRTETNDSAVFVSKLNADGTALVYSTYISGQGGNSNNLDHGYAIAVDSAGNAYITGDTNSTGFPITYGPGPTGFAISTFVCKLNPTGTRLIYSTLLPGADAANAIAVDRTGGSAYLAGSASNKFPTTAGAYQPTAGNSYPSETAFLAKLNKTGSGFIYSTFLGNPGTRNLALAVDAAGDAYVTGYKSSTSTFPTTPGALSATGTVYVTKFNPSGSALLYSTFLQGDVYPRAMAIDTTGAAYVTGYVFTAISTTPGAFQTSTPGNGFVMKLNAAGSAYDYSTYLGGSSFGQGHGIKADAKGNAYVVGDTYAKDYPVTADAFQPTFVGKYLSATFSVLNGAGSALLYSTFLSGSGGASALSVALDPSDSAYVAGIASPDLGDAPISFPVTSGAYQTTISSDNSNSFVTKFLFPPSGSMVQSILFRSLGDRVYGTGPINLTATASSGLPVTYAVSGPATLSGNSLTVYGAGQVTVIASQAGNSVYDSAPDVFQTFTVHKAKIHATADNVIRPVGTANPTFSYSLTGFVRGDKSSVVSGAATESTTAIASSGPGTYPITFASESLTADNYDFVYVSGTLTVTSQQCQTITSYANGFTSAGLSLNRGAKIVGNVLQLTDGRKSQARTAFYESPVLITEFTTDFSFQLVDAVADGITFTLQSNNAKVVGIAGGGLAYRGIPNSAAIKFDLHPNQGEGFDSMGFYQEGAPPTIPDVDLTQTGIDLHSGHVFNVHIAYSNPDVAVVIKDTQTGASVSQTFVGDLSTTVGPGAYVGFTASTGDKTAIQNILSWSFAGGPACSNTQLPK